jgi:hypothetical protein
VRRIAAGSEGIRLRLVDQIHARHRQLRPPRQLPDHIVKIGQAGFIDFLRVVHAQHHLVGKPVGKNVHRAAQQQRQQHALGTAQQRADGTEQGHDAGHQNRGFQPVANHVFLRQFNPGHSPTSR